MTEWVAIAVLSLLTVLHLILSIRDKRKLDEQICELLEAQAEVMRAENEMKDEVIERLRKL